MAHDNSLPFIKIGQHVEIMSFVRGFRGAWFRCKITDIGLRGGQLSCALEYYDFPDEKVTWEKVYQYNPADGKMKKKGKTLKMRPPFPSIYDESKMPDANTVLEEVVIVCDTWKVGDLVDWMQDGCYWSGKVTEVLGQEKLKLELPLPPVGEGVKGHTDEASYKDLRSSLDWSLEYGWTVPTTKERENGYPCVRLLKPNNQGYIPSLASQTVGDGKRDVQEIAGSDRSLAAKDADTEEINMESDVAESQFVKNCSYTDFNLHVKDALSHRGGTASRLDSSESSDNDWCLKRMKADEDTILNSMTSDTFEATILDFEELVNQIKWMKGMLETGKTSAATMRPRWKFVKNQTPPLQSEGFH